MISQAVTVMLIIIYQLHLIIKIHDNLSTLEVDLLFIICIIMLKSENLKGRDH
jgi:hypothetical protein